MDKTKNIETETICYSPQSNGRRKREQEREKEREIEKDMVEARVVVNRKYAIGEIQNRSRAKLVGLFADLLFSNTERRGHRKLM